MRGAWVGDAADFRPHAPAERCPGARAGLPDTRASQRFVGGAVGLGCAGAAVAGAVTRECRCGAVVLLAGLERLLPLCEVAARTAAAVGFTATKFRVSAEIPAHAGRLLSSRMLGKFTQRSYATAALVQSLIAAPTGGASNHVPRLMPISSNAHRLACFRLASTRTGYLR